MSIGRDPEPSGDFEDDDELFEEEEEEEDTEEYDENEPLEDEE